MRRIHLPFLLLLLLLIASCSSAPKPAAPATAESQNNETAKPTTVEQGNKGTSEQATPTNETTKPQNNETTAPTTPTNETTKPQNNETTTPTTPTNETTKPQNNETTTPTTPTNETTAPTTPTMLPATALPPEPTSTTIAATKAPQRLPAALYLSDTRGRLMRFASDGSVALVVQGTPGVQIPFAIAADSDQLAYALNGATAQLYLSDSAGKQAQVIFEQAGVQFNNLVFAPDEKLLLFAVVDPNGLSQLWQLPIGGKPELFSATGVPAETVLTPLFFAPNGNLLLVGITLPGADICGQGVIDLKDRHFTALEPLGGSYTDCSYAAWSSDSKQIILTLQTTGSTVASQPGLWQADPQTGVITPFIAAKQPAGFLRVAYPSPFTNSTIYALATYTASDEAPDPNGPVLTYDLYQASQNGQPQLVRNTGLAAIGATWASDNTGAAVVVSSTNPGEVDLELYWVPIQGNNDKLGSVTYPFQIAWGK